MSREEANRQSRIYGELSDLELMELAKMYDRMSTEDSKEHSMLIHQECNKRSECYL